MKFFRIRDWAKHFENNRTKELKSLSWVPVPNKMDGDGYTELWEHEDGHKIFAAFILIVEIASKCDPRGTLLRDRQKPHNPQSLARLSRCPAGCFEIAIPMLLQIGWLEEVEINPAAGCEIPAAGCLEGKGREGKEKKGREDSTAPQVVDDNSMFAPEYRKASEALSSKNLKITHHDFVVLFTGSRQGMKPASVIDELCALIRGEPENRWERYGVPKCLGYMLDDIGKRYEKSQGGTAGYSRRPGI